MDTDVLAQLIGSKHELLLQIRQLVARQAEWVAADDMTRIMQVLAVKQRLLDALQDVERRLDPFRQEDPERRIWRTPDDRQRTRDLSARCDALLREILSLERTCESTMVQRRDQAATQLQGAHRSAQVASAYQGAGDPSGRQFDASCET
jgi:hypothetical protein